MSVSDALESKLNNHDNSINYQIKQFEDQTTVIQEKNKQLNVTISNLQNQLKEYILNHKTEYNKINNEKDDLNKINLKQNTD